MNIVKLIAVLIVIVYSSVAYADDIYTWIGRDGDIHFTDDVEMIPAEADVTILETLSLDSYPKYTPSYVDNEEYRVILEKRLQVLRQINSVKWRY